MTALRTLIVDDEHLARRGLAMRLADIESVDVLAECANGEQALAAIVEHSPDLIFLDIQMPGMSGFDVVARIQGDTMPMVIFVTAFNEFAVDAFKVNAIDYVLKPLETDRLHEAVDRAVRAHEQQVAALEKERLLNLVMDMQGQSAMSLEAPEEDVTSKKLMVKDGGEVQFIPLADIEWVDAAGDYMCVHAAGQTHVMRSTMKELEAQLADGDFARIHRSTIVNLRHVAGAKTLAGSDYQLTLESGAQLKVSRGYKSVVRNFMSESR